MGVQDATSAEGKRCLWAGGLQLNLDKRGGRSELHPWSSMEPLSLIRVFVRWSLLLAMAGLWTSVNRKGLFPVMDAWRAEVQRVFVVIRARS